MKMTLKSVIAGATLAVLLGSVAHASISAAYMTDTSNPWGQSTEDTAMNQVFGVGGWTKVAGFTSSVFSSGYNFIYIDGGDGTSTDFNAFILSNLGAIQSFVSSGGRMMINAAQWDFSPDPLDLGFGQTLYGDGSYDYASYNGSLTAAGSAAGLGANGAGTSWGGNYFAHDIVYGGGATCLVTGTAGCVFQDAKEGAGYLTTGGETAPYFWSGVGSPQQLLDNEISYTATVVSTPEPATCAMLLLGFAGLGFAGYRKARGGQTALSAA
jgi:hypothetical protein